MSNPLHPLWGRKAAQIALALCCFALPILFAPLASRESGTDLWVRAGLSKSTVKKVLIPASTVPSRYTLVADQGVYRSSDNGVTWRDVNNGLPPAQWGRIGVQALAVDEDEPFVLYAGMQEIGGRESAFGTGLYVSDDDGATWLPLGRDMVGKEVQTIAVWPALALPEASGQDSESPTSVVCVATGGELYRSADRGQSWSRLDWRGVETRILSLAIHPANPDIIYVGTQGGGIYSTEDGGVSWVAMNQGLDDLDVHEIAISVNETRLIYLATNGGVYKSLDAGWTWTRLGGATEGRFVHTIALHPQDGNVLYVGLQYGAVFCSMDGGTEWTAVKRGLGDLSVLALELDPRNPSILWAGTTDGIWRCVLGPSVSLAATSPASVASATPRPDPASTETPVPTPTFRPSATASPTASPTHTAPATMTVPPTLSPTTTHTPTPSATLTPTLTERAAPPPPTLTPPAPTETPIR
jgi:photosystem II stability/assembly factor-like uncharacterized protein